MSEIEEAALDSVRDNLQRVLVVTARAADKITYTDIVKTVVGPEGPWFEGPRSRALAHMLGQINANEIPYRDKPLLLSAVVVHIEDRYPGEGFYEAAKELGCSVPNDDIGQHIFWGLELERVHEAYGRQGDGR